MRSLPPLGGVRADVGWWYPELELIITLRVIGCSKNYVISRAGSHLFFACGLSVVLCCWYVLICAIV